MQAFGILDNYPGIDGMPSIIWIWIIIRGKSNVHGFKTALVALKSTELISGLWKDVEVNGEDLVRLTPQYLCFVH